MKVNIAYLKTLKASDFTSGQYSNNNELLEEWNALQKTPRKRRNFTFMEIELADKIARYLAKSYPDNGSVKWAWIYHNKDNSEHEHYHFYLEFPNPRSFSSVANELLMPVTNLQVVLDKKAILQYLTHENAPDKHHYDKSEIHSNFNIDNELTNQKPNLHKEFEDWKAVREGRLSFHDFIDIYECTFYDIRMVDRLRIYDKALGYDKK